MLSTERRADPAGLMKAIMQSMSLGRRYISSLPQRIILPTLLMMLAAPAHASIFKGEALDTAADVLTWIVLVIAPVIAIAIFWLVHILPEKIAEKKKHPQVKAIQTLCLLSLAFGGMLWPLAWLWAYTKPVLYKQAYGTDTVEPEHGPGDASSQGGTAVEEIKRLREQVTALQAKLAGSQPPGKGKNV